MIFRHKTGQPYICSLLALAGLLSAGCSTTTGPATAEDRLSPADVEAIEVLMKSYTEAWREGIPEKVMDCFTDDPVIMPHHGVPPRVGASEIAEFWWPAGQAGSSGVEEFVIEPQEIAGVGQIAYVRARFRLSFWIEEDGERASVRSEGNHFSVLRKTDSGQWRIHRSIWNDPPVERP